MSKTIFLGLKAAYDYVEVSGSGENRRTLLAQYIHVSPKSVQGRTAKLALNDEEVERIGLDLLMSLPVDRLAKSSEFTKLMNMVRAESESTRPLAIE